MAGKASVLFAGNVLGDFSRSRLLYGHGDHAAPAVDAERQIDVLTEAFGEDAVDAAQAKDAIIDLVRTKQVDFRWNHATADEMAQLPLTRRDEGNYNFGPFHINLRERTYNAHLGPAMNPTVTAVHSWSKATDGRRCRRN